jgi:1,4-dihydroxy-2-naphthoate octaprenyltransferase/chlorophyll synthase
VHPALLPWPKRWLYALKVASWPKLLAPMLLGQAIGGVTAGAWSPAATLLGFAYAVALTCAIVLLNDFADRRVDALKRRLFPEGCSAKTIPDGVLGAQAVLLGGLGAGALSLGIAAIGELWLARPGLLAAAAGALGVFVAYSLPPLRRNYRGGGEYLEMLGVGVVLPWLGAYLQGGDPAPALAGALLPGFALLALASAVTSGLADEVSDRRGGKDTFATRYGNPFCRVLGENLIAAGAILWAFAARVTPELLTPWVILPPILALLFHWRALIEISDAATTNRFPAIRRYKAQLNLAIAQAAALLALALVISALLGGATQADGPQDIAASPTCSDEVAAPTTRGGWV